VHKESIILFPFQEVKKGSKIIIYGAGDVGQAFYWELFYSGYAEVVGWIDKSWENVSHIEKPKMYFSQLHTVEFDYVVIAINSQEVVKTVCDLLQKAGVPKSKIVYKQNNVLHYELINYKKLYENNTTAEIKEVFDKKRPLRLGFIAAGDIARTIAKTVNNRTTGMELYAVAARDGNRARDFAQEHGFEKWYASYEELVMDENVEVVYISTPLSFHYEHTMLALSHGKHVICEKPIAANAKQLEEMIAYAKQKGLFFADGLWISYMPIMKEVEKLRQEELLGEIKGVVLNVTYPNVPNRLLQYDLCGGGWLELGCYLVHMIFTLLGKDIREIKAIGMKTENGVDAQEGVLFAYQDAMAIIYCSIQAVSDKYAYVYGERGYAIIEDANEPVKIRIYNKARKLVKQVELEKGYQFQMLACAEAIQNGFLETSERSHAIMLEQMQILEQVKKKINLCYEADKEE